MKELKNRNKNGIFYVVISFVAVLGVAGAIRAYSLSQNVNVAGNYNYYESENQPSEADVNFGASPGGYLTINEVEYGADSSARLNFSAAATTTPGSLFKILNTSKKICGPLEVNITTGSTTGGAAGGGSAFAYSISTSTSPTAWSTKAGGLMASTTIATSTTPLQTSVSNAGSYVGADQDVGGESWVWDKGVWLIGAFDDKSKSDGAAEYATSSAAYTGMRGNVYVKGCHVVD